MTITQHKILKQGRFRVTALGSHSSTLHEQLQCFLLRSEDSTERERQHMRVRGEYMCGDETAMKQAHASLHELHVCIMIMSWC